MIQANIPDELRVNLEFESSAFSRTVRVLNPTVYRDGDTYSCLLGPDSISGILGHGLSPADAVKDWEANVQARISSPKEDDEVAQFVIDSLNTSKNDVW